MSRLIVDIQEYILKLTNLLEKTKYPDRFQIKIVTNYLKEEYPQGTACQKEKMEITILKNINKNYPVLLNLKHMCCPKMVLCMQRTPFKVLEAVWILRT